MLKPAFIDLSHHNVIPSSLVPAAQSGIVGVIHKLTEGTSYVDDKVESRLFLAENAGLLWGLYHFIRPGHITDQAEFFVDTAHRAEVADKNTLWCLDWEDTGVTLDDALEFLRGVQQLTGHEPVLYSGHVLKEALGGKPNSEISNYRLWLAQYGPEPELPPGFDEFWGWQYTDQGRCPGINPPVDLNAYNGTAENLRRDWSGADEVPPVDVARVEINVTGNVVVIVNGKPVD